MAVFSIHYWQFFIKSKFVRILPEKYHYMILEKNDSENHSRIIAYHFDISSNFSFILCMANLGSLLCGHVL